MAVILGYDSFHEICLQGTYADFTSSQYHMKPEWLDSRRLY